ncbi:MAG: hypothetical protein WCT77_02855 [Bacteroidota bacterium]
MNQGKIYQIDGPVIDVEFTEGQIPPILNQLQIPRTSPSTGAQDDLICVVTQHLGIKLARSFTSGSTYGLKPGMIVYDTGIPVPILDPIPIPEPIPIIQK